MGLARHKVEATKGRKPTVLLKIQAIKNTIKIQAIHLPSKLKNQRET